MLRDVRPAKRIRDELDVVTELVAGYGVVNSVGEVPDRWKECVLSHVPITAKRVI